MNSFAALNPLLRKGLKVLAYLGLGFVSLVSILVCGLHLFLKNESGQKWLANQIEEALLKSQGHTVTVGSITAVNTRVFNIKGLKVYNSLNEIAAQADLLEFKISLSQLLKARMPLSSISIPSAEINIEALKHFKLQTGSSDSKGLGIPSIFLRGDTTLKFEHLVVYEKPGLAPLKPLHIESRALWSPLTAEIELEALEKQDGELQPKLRAKFYSGLSSCELELQTEQIHALSPLIGSASVKELKNSELTLLIESDESFGHFLINPVADYKLKIEATHTSFPQPFEFFGTGQFDLKLLQTHQNWSSKFPGLYLEGALSWDPEKELHVNAMGRTKPEEDAKTLLPIDSKNIKLDLYLNTLNLVGHAKLETDFLKYETLSPFTDFNLELNWLNPSHITASVQSQWLHQSMKGQFEIHRPSPQSFELEKIELASQAMTLCIDPSKDNLWKLKAKLGSSFLSDLTQEMKLEGIYASTLELEAQLLSPSSKALLLDDLRLHAKDFGVKGYSCRKLEAHSKAELSFAQPNQSTLHKLAISGSQIKKGNKLLIDQLEGSTWGNPKALFYDINLKKEAQFEGLDSPFDLHAQGFIDLGLVDRLAKNDKEHPLIIGIDSLKGSWSNLRANLIDPCVIMLGSENIQIQNLNLDIGEGLWKGWAHLTPSEILVSSEMYEVPADLLQYLTGSSVRGLASGLIELDLRAGNCQAQVDMRLRGLQVSQMHKDLPPVDGIIKLDWGQNQIDFSSKLVNSKDFLACKVLGKLEPPTSFDLLREIKGDIDLSLEGRLGLFSYLFTSQDFDFDGQVKGGLHIKGTGKRPLTKGEITITQGSYDHYPIGLTLRKVQAHLIGKGTKIHLDYLKASDGDIGEASASGDLSLLGATSSQSFLKFHGFRFLHIPLVTVAATGECQFLHKGKGAQLKGEILLTQAQVRLPDQLPSPVPQLDAYNIIYETEAPLATKVASENLFTGKVEFDLIAEIPQASLKGRGLDTSWKGNIHLKGDDEDPLLRGHIDIENGEFSFASKKFEVKEGYLDFAGNPLQESTIHMIAEMRVDQVTLRAMLNGPLAKPRLQFRSSPNLSMSDFFSYLLFNQPHSSLSGFQALQVAQLALETSGDGSVGFFTQLRKNTGIDRLEVGGRESLANDTDGDLYTIKVGKYLSDGVLVGVSKDVSAEGTQITFELDLTKHLSLITEIGYLTSSSINLMWKKEY